MLTLLRIGSGLALVLAIVSFSLWRDLRTERALTADLREQMTSSADRSPGPAAGPVAALPPQGAELRTASAAAPSNNVGGGPEAAPTKAALAAAAVRIESGFNPERDLMKDPEYRKARLTQARMNLKRVYSDVSEEVGLSDRETEQLFDLLAERDLGPGISVAIGPDGQPDRQSLDEMRRAQAENQRRQQEALQALIGPARQTKWQDYQQTLSARSRVVAMTSMLASSGAPLTEAQLKPLTTALIAEERYVRQQQSTSRPAGPMTPELRAQMQEESVNREEESNRRYLDAAAANMTPQQVALVRVTLEQQIAVSRANARLQRQRAEAQRSGATPGP